MGIGINPPVKRIFLVGPVKAGKTLACRMYPFCRESRWLPAFFAEEALTLEVEQLFFHPLVRTGVVIFGEDSERAYERLRKIRGEGTWLKALRLLEPGAAAPRPFFSYEEQVFPWPGEEADIQRIVSWMGIVPFGAWKRHESVYPGALPPETLGRDEKADWLPQEKEVYL